MSHLTLEFKKPEATEWDRLGTFRASETELQELRVLLEGKDPLEALDTLPAGIVRDALQIILIEERWAARVSFSD